MNIQPSVLTFAQNSRDEVCVQGDGQVRGALSASQGSKQQTYVAQTRDAAVAGFKYSAGAGAGSIGYSPELSPTATADWHAPAMVSFDQTWCLADDNAKAAVDRDMCGTLKVCGSAPHVARRMSVRRLTPRECERLQGFPDDWTLVPYRGREADRCPDGPRYKAVGNSMAIPVMRWIGERIQGVMDREEIEG